MGCGGSSVNTVAVRLIGDDILGAKMQQTVQVAEVSDRLVPSDALFEWSLILTNVTLRHLVEEHGVERHALFRAELLQFAPKMILDGFVGHVAAVSTSSALTPVLLGVVVLVEQFAAFTTESVRLLLVDDDVLGHLLFLAVLAHCFDISFPLIHVATKA